MDLLAVGLQLIGLHDLVGLGLVLVLCFLVHLPLFLQCFQVVITEDLQSWRGDFFKESCGADVGFLALFGNESIMERLSDPFTDVNLLLGDAFLEFRLEATEAFLGCFLRSDDFHNLLGVELELQSCQP